MRSFSPSEPGKSRGSILQGTELKGVQPALPFLESARHANPLAGRARRVAIVGGGNAAIDSARTLLRMGSEATIFYRRERKDMPAIDEEILAAEEEGVNFVFLAAPHRIIGDAKGNVKALEIVKTRLGEYDSSGRRRPVPTDQVMRFDCDAVILAVGETFDLDFCRASGLELKEEGTIKVDRFTLETSRPVFYAGGDVITGASNVSNAMAGGKQAARAMDESADGRIALGAAVSRFGVKRRRCRRSQPEPPARCALIAPRRSAFIPRTK